MQSISMPGRFWTENEGATGHEICVVGTDIVDESFRRHLAGPRDRPGVLLAGRPLSNRWRAAAAGQNLRRFARQCDLHSLFALIRRILVRAFTRWWFSSRRLLPNNLKRPKTRCARSCAIVAARHSATRDDEGFTLETSGRVSNLYAKATSNIYIVTIWCGGDFACSSAASW